MTKKKLLLLDGNSLAYRAFFALPLLTNANGVHTNAVYGFTMMLNQILKEEKPSHMLVAWDAGKTTFRHEQYAEYKGGRQKTPPELSEQFPYIRQLLEAYRIPQYELDLYEADDIIGTFSRLATEEDDVEVVVISGDKDLTQLVTERTTVCITRKGITDLEVYTPTHVQEKYGISPHQIIDMKGLMGDASDNIPGVPGVGEKTALKLLKQFGSIEKIYDAIEQVSGKKLKENLTTNEEQALMSKKLATIEVQVPLTITMQEIQYEGPDEDAVRTIYEQLQFKSLMNEMSPQKSVALASIDVVIKTTIEASDFSKEMAFQVEMMDENYLQAPILGFSLSDGKKHFFVSTETALASPSFKAWLEDDQHLKYVSDSKAAYAALARHQLTLHGVEFDLLLASYIVNPQATYTDVASMAEAFGSQNVEKDEVVYGKGAKRAVPAIEKVAEHAVRKAHAIWQLRPDLEKQLKENEQFDLYHELEMPLAKILGKMESMGVRVDRQVLQQIGTELSSRLHELEQKIYALAGQTFNINSPKQLGVILFEKLGLTPIKKTKTGYSTAADVLEKLEPEHEVIQHILLYRQLGKLNSTYIEGLMKEIHEDEKIHTRFQQALTQTGRLSSINPNLQNIPIRLEEGRKIRAAFVPAEQGWYMFAADYSQIELRVLAHISQDAKMIEAFQNDEDIHTKTAMDVFQVAKEDVTPNMRRTAKAVNFGIVYGISDYGLSQNLNITRKEAAQFIETYLQTFPGVKRYMASIVEEAKEKGYVTTLLNRRRYLPDIRSSNFNMRSFAERTAMNTPIQGSAADIIKKAMIDIDARLSKEKLRARMLLQVHDELIFEAPEEELPLLQKIVPEVMEQALTLDVPLKVDWAYGLSWYETK